MKMNIFGSNHNELGSLNDNLILNTAGKIKVRFGSKFIDLLNEKGELNIPTELLNRINSLEREIKLLKERMN